MSDRGEQLIDGYLRDLSRELDGLPRGRREELVDDIRRHVDESLAGTDGGEAAVRTALDELGDPAAIAAEVPGQPSASAEFGSREVWTLLLLAFGGWLLLIGWLVGVVRLWDTGGWTSREKLLGTLLPPGGLFFVVVMNWIAIGVEWGVGGIALLSAMGLGLLLGICVPIYLGVTLHRRARQAA
jgi:hypothetical protein